MAFGVQPEGFVAKRITDVEDNIIAKLQQYVNPKISIDITANFMQLLSPFAEELEKLWAELEKLSQQRNSNDAVQVSLDYILDYIGLKRQFASQGLCPVGIKGDEGTVLVQSFQVSQDQAPLEIFSIKNQSTITKDNLTSFYVRVDSFVGSFDYEITANGTVYKYTSAGFGTIEDVVNGLVSIVNTYGGANHVLVAEKLTDEALHLTPKDIDQLDTTLVSDNLSHLNDFEFVAVNTGEFVIPIGTINNIVTNTVGVDEALNFVEGVPGRNDETDSEARTRRKNSFASTGDATLDAITAGLLNVEGVTFADTLENDTMAADTNGLDPKSIKCIVENGDEQEIAQKIWDKKAGGISTNGDILRQAKDIKNRDKPILFSRPIPKYAWLFATVVRDTDPDNLPESNFIQQIEDALLSYGNDYFGLSTDMVDQKFACAAQHVQGVLTISVQMDATNSPGDTPVFQSGIIAIGDDEKAEFDPSRITVVE